MRRFLVVFGLVAVVIAGALSYLASSSPDGLDSVTQRGCSSSPSESDELTGECIAQDARDHALADGPLADYAVGGDDRLTGVAGVLGVLATFVVAGGLFWVLRRRTPQPQ